MPVLGSSKDHRDSVIVTDMTREELGKAIAARLRAGVSYCHCDTDGYHDEVAFRDGHFIHADGFRATTNPPERLASEDDALARIRAVHPKLEGASELDVLRAILATLEATAA